MCTLVFAVRPSPDVLLAVTGNRNEFLARPASPPRVWPELPGVLMPRDEMAGGTWLGLTARGLFVCVTNRRGAAPDPARPSRGLLVLEALRAPDAAAVRQMASALPPSRYNGFHLVFADAREAGVAICDGERLEVRTLAPGDAHLVTERSYGAGEGVREAEVLREVAPLLLHPEVTAAMLRRKLGDEMLPSRTPGRLAVTFQSFGFKYGPARDPDLLFDVRFLPNPHYEQDLRPLTGDDPRVLRFINRDGELDAFYQLLHPLLDYLLPHYLAEGKAHLVIAIGCTGGRHRAVAIAEHLAARYSPSDEYLIEVVHRDVSRAS